MRGLKSSRPLPYPAIVGAVGALLVVGGLGYWGYRLSQPMPELQRPAAVPPAADDGTAHAVAQWLTPGPQSVQLTVSGVLFTASRAAAVMSVNGGPLRAYMAGDKLGHAITLRRVESNGVVLDKAGATVRVLVPTLPELETGGIVRVK